MQGRDANIILHFAGDESVTTFRCLQDSRTELPGAVRKVDSVCSTAGCVKKAYISDYSLMFALCH